MSAIANTVGLTWCRITVPWSGIALIEMNAPEPVLPVAGVVSVLMGDLAVSCALVSDRAGEFAGSWSGFAVAGRGGWDKPVSAKGYQSPFGVLNTQVIQDAARECGELPPAVTVPFSLGPFYVRKGPASGRKASQVFDKLPPFCDWWVDLPTGITQVNIRPPTAVTADFQIIESSKRSGVLKIATDNPAQFQPNATFIDPQEGVFTVNAAVWVSDNNSFRGDIWIA